MIESKMLEHQNVIEYLLNLDSISLYGTSFKT